MTQFVCLFTVATCYEYSTLSLLFHYWYVSHPKSGNFRIQFPKFPFTFPNCELLFPNLIQLRVVIPKFDVDIPKFPFLFLNSPTMGRGSNTAILQYEILGEVRLWHCIELWYACVPTGWYCLCSGWSYSTKPLFPNRYRKPRWDWDHNPNHWDCARHLGCDARGRNWEYAIPAWAGCWTDWLRMAALARPVKNGRPQVRRFCLSYASIEISDGSYVVPVGKSWRGLQIVQTYCIIVIGFVFALRAFETFRWILCYMYICMCPPSRLPNSFFRLLLALCTVSLNSPSTVSVK